MIFKTEIDSYFKYIYRCIVRKRKSKTFVYKYLRKIYISINSSSVDEKELESKVYGFIVKTLIIFATIFIITYKINTNIYSPLYAIIKSFLISIIISSIPYLILILKLYNKQKSSSKEATIIVNEITNQYNIYNKNMIEAIDAAIKNLDDSIICKRYLLRLSIRIKEYQTDKELLDILDEFTFTVNTNWIRMLSDTIFFSVTENIDVTLSLNGLIEQIGLINYTKNVGSRLNNEGFSMAKYLAPILYFILVIVAVKLVDIDFKEFFYYQFTGQGLVYFILIVLLFALSYACEYFYKNRKFDF